MKKHLQGDPASLSEWNCLLLRYQATCVRLADRVTHGNVWGWQEWHTAMSGGQFVWREVARLANSPYRSDLSIPQPSHRRGGGEWSNNTAIYSSPPTQPFLFPSNSWSSLTASNIPNTHWHFNLIYLGEIGKLKCRAHGLRAIRCSEEFCLPNFIIAISVLIVWLLTHHRRI